MACDPRPGSRCSRPGPGRAPPRHRRRRTVGLGPSRASRRKAPRNRKRRRPSTPNCLPFCGPRVHPTELGDACSWNRESNWSAYRRTLGRGGTRAHQSRLRASVPRVSIRRHRGRRVPQPLTPDLSEEMSPHLARLPATVEVRQQIARHVLLVK